MANFNDSFDSQFRTFFSARKSSEMARNSSDMAKNSSERIPA